MDKSYYPRYAVMERSHWWFIARERILSSIIRDKIAKPGNKLRILNVGAATGRSSEWLGEFGDVTTVEYDKDCCDYLKSIGIQAFEASITALPFDAGVFDLVCAFDVIEHVEDDVLAIEEMERVLCPSGFSFITVPALMALWSEHDVVNHHHRRYTKDSLLAAASKTLMKVNKISYFNSLLFPLIYVARLYSKIFKSDQEISDFDKFKPGGLPNKIFKMIFSSERFWLKNAGFFVGVSLLLLLKKK